MNIQTKLKEIEAEDIDYTDENEWPDGQDGNSNAIAQMIEDNEPKCTIEYHYPTDDGLKCKCGYFTKQ